jgi:hypothetical protein
MSVFTNLFLFLIKRSCCRTSNLFFFGCYALGLLFFFFLSFVVMYMECHIVQLFFMIYVCIII